VLAVAFELQGAVGDDVDRLLLDQRALGLDYQLLAHEKSRLLAELEGKLDVAGVDVEQFACEH
jgi:hypothetical protein